MITSCSLLEIHGFNIVEACLISWPEFVSDEQFLIIYFHFKYKEVHALKILIFGGRGMAGHLIRDYLTQVTRHNVWCTVRGQTKDPNCIPLDVRDEPHVISLLEQLQPDVVINAVGLLNENAARHPADAIYVNSLFPHRLAQHGRRWRYRLIHISTDCVFSGKRGNYTETDTPDGCTIYSMTKNLGEIVDDTNLSIRTSIIGPELNPDGIGLFHWFMSQKGAIRGYQRVFWNGVTTLELAKAVEWTINHPISGLIHLSVPDKISKYGLLNLLKEIFKGKSPVIQPCNKIISDKSLVNTRRDFTYPVSDYSVMLKELKEWMESRTPRRYPYG